MQRATGARPNSSSKCAAQFSEPVHAKIVRQQSGMPECRSPATRVSELPAATAEHDEIRTQPRAANYRGTWSWRRSLGACQATL
jgi:hypothetical protein